MGLGTGAALLRTSSTFPSSSLSLSPAAVASSPVAFATAAAFLFSSCLVLTSFLASWPDLTYCWKAPAASVLSSTCAFVRA